MHYACGIVNLSKMSHLFLRKHFHLSLKFRARRLSLYFTKHNHKLRIIIKSEKRQRSHKNDYHRQIHSVFTVAQFCRATAQLIEPELVIRRCLTLFLALSRNITIFRNKNRRKTNLVPIQSMRNFSTSSVRVCSFTV